MNRLKKVLSSLAGTLAAFALFIGILTANSACAMIYHQPSEPEAMTKYKL